MPAVAVVTPAKAAALSETGTAEATDDSESDEDAADPDASYATICKETSLEHAAAEIAFDALSGKIHNLGWTADPKPLEEDLEKLLEHPCFELAKIDSHELLTFASAVSLRHWWLEGGSDWLYSYLRADKNRYLRASPTPRLALTIENAPKDHPLAPLLCPADTSKPCAIESTGWARRASEKLTLVANRHRNVKDEIDCREEAEKQPKADRYAAFRECLEGGFERTQALPIGRFKAPSDGWLVINDDNVSCRTMRAFHLVTGSVYESTDCRRSDQAKAQTTVGRVPVGALREAAWMLVLARETQPEVRFSEGFNVPDKIPIKRARGESIGLGRISCGCGPSRRRSWSWMREKNGTLSGQVSGVIVGRGDDDAIRHAFDLLDIADAALEKGCAPSPPPARIAWSAPGPSSREGEAAVIDDAPSEAVRLALTKAKLSRTCTPKP